MKNLFMKQKVFKITDHYTIFDEGQNVVYRVDQDFKMIGNTVHVSDANGTERFVVDKEIFTFLPRFAVRFASGDEVYLKSRFTFFKKEIEVDPDQLGILLQGDFFDFNFDIMKDHKIIGSIQRELLSWGDSYHIQVVDDRYQDLVVALMIAVDCIKDDQERN